MQLRSDVDDLRLTTLSSLFKLSLSRAFDNNELKQTAVLICQTLVDFEHELNIL